MEKGKICFITSIISLVLCLFFIGIFVYLLKFADNVSRSMSLTFGTISIIAFVAFLGFYISFVILASKKENNF